MARPEKQRLASRLLAVSLHPRPLDLRVVVAREIRPWRYPGRMDFQYGDWWRDDFERGDVEPWPSATDPDLATRIRLVLLADSPLLGPPPAEVFDPHGGRKPGFGAVTDDSTTIPRCCSCCLSSCARSAGCWPDGAPASGAQELEILVLRHQLRVLKRKTGRPSSGRRTG